MMKFKGLPLHVRCTWQTEQQYINFKKGDDMKKNKEKNKCSMCGEKCNLIEETIDYAGTHCTNGNGGTYRTGSYVSDCCFVDVEEI